MNSNRVWFMTHWLKVELKQSTLFFNKQISFSIIKEVHAIDKLDDEATLARQTYESKSFCKVVFFFEDKSVGPEAFHSSFDDD